VKSHDLLIQVRSAYAKLTHQELQLFCSVRSLSVDGSHEELVFRLAQYDNHTYSFPSNPNGSRNGINGHSHPKLPTPRPRQVKAPDLPIELLAEIMDHVGDWELSKAVGLPTSIPQPPEWTRANQTDHAVLTGYTPLIRAADPSARAPSRIGATLAARFAYIHVLEYFLTHHRSKFRMIFRDYIIPVTASQHGRVSVLAWWKNASEIHPDAIPPASTNTLRDAMDGASRNGQVASLDWWLHSGIRLEYTESALEMASAKNHLDVLEWWKKENKTHHGRLPLKIGRVMDMASTAGHVEVLDWWVHSQLEYKYDRLAMYHASCHGKVEVLQWWLTSGLQLVYDADCLTGATKHNRPEVLEWWNRSSLPIQYRMCDIEEALEDAIGGGEEARDWWKKKGIDFNTNDKEWMKFQNLN